MSVDILRLPTIDHEMTRSSIEARLPFTVEQILRMEWEEHSGNPLIKPNRRDFGYLADPTVLAPEQSPDREWHLIAPTSINLTHFTSSDGIVWERIPKPVMKGAVRPYLTKEGDTYYLFATKVIKMVPFSDTLSSVIVLSKSNDLITWSKPETVLEPQVPLQQQAVGNPSIIKVNGEYSLYYSGGTAYLTDCYFTEPYGIWVARSKNIEGPYNLIDENPILCADMDDSHMNIGAGSMKVFRTADNMFVGFQNTVHRDDRGRSTSAIRIMSSFDGMSWSTTSQNYIVLPNASRGEQFAYACDVAFHDGKLYLYYNTRWHLFEASHLPDRVLAEAKKILKPGDYDRLIRTGTGILGIEQICLSIGTLPAS